MICKNSKALKKVYDAILGAVTIEYTEATQTNRSEGVTVSKALIAELSKKYDIILTDTEDEKNLNIRVIRKEREDKQNETKTKTSIPHM
jgi:hypothetical protein